MTALGDAFAAIESGTADDFVISDGLREYRFDGFSIIVDPNNPVVYLCEDNPAIVDAFDSSGPNTVRLKRSGNLVVARQVRAASGAKYEADRGITFWTKGDEAMVEWPQGNRFDCRVRP
jgi:membrane-bound inhibitor of C-type lysozyme